MVLDGGEWDDEIARWKPDADVTQVAYSSLTLREKGPKGGSRPTSKLKPEYVGPWDTVIADEAHHLKGRKTTWAVAAHSIKTERIFLSTGTPIPNWAYELFMLLRLLRPDDALPGRELGSYWRWANKWFKFERKPWATTITGDMAACSKECYTLPEGTCEHWIDFYEENLGDDFLRRLRDDVMDQLPPMTEQWINCRMGKEQAKVYRELKKDWVAWVDETDFEVVAWNDAALTVKLAKAATGLPVLDPTATRGSAVLERYRMDLQDRDQPTIVAAQFRDTVMAADVIARGLGFRTSVVMGGSRGQAATAVREFKAGATDVLLCTIDKVREGLNLQRADCVMMLERSYSPYKNEQVIRRIHRGGQTRPVSVRHYVTEGTIHERVIKVAAQKTDRQMRSLRPAQLRELA